MGDMADMALEETMTMEDLRDRYVNGEMPMQEAFEHGFLDPVGVEQEGIQEAWDRNDIQTMENLNRELDKQSDLLTIAVLSDRDIDTLDSSKSQAVKKPFCKKCHKAMTICMGKFGRFFYCQHRCSGQSTINAEKWLKLNV